MTIFVIGFVVAALGAKCVSIVAYGRQTDIKAACPQVAQMGEESEPKQSLRRWNRIEARADSIFEAATIIAVVFAIARLVVWFSVP